MKKASPFSPYEYQRDSRIFNNARKSTEPYRESPEKQNTFERSFLHDVVLTLIEKLSQRIKHVPYEQSTDERDFLLYLEGMASALLWGGKLSRENHDPFRDNPFDFSVKNPDGVSYFLDNQKIRLFFSEEEISQTIFASAHLYFKSARRNLSIEIKNPSRLNAARKERFIKMPVEENERVKNSTLFFIRNAIETLSQEIAVVKRDKLHSLLNVHYTLQNMLIALSFDGSLVKRESDAYFSVQYSNGNISTVRISDIQACLQKERFDYLINPFGYHKLDISLPKKEGEEVRRYTPQEEMIIWFINASAGAVLFNKDTRLYEILRKMQFLIIQSQEVHISPRIDASCTIRSFCEIPTASFSLRGDSAPFSITLSVAEIRKNVSREKFEKILTLLSKHLGGKPPQRNIKK